MKPPLVTAVFLLFVCSLFSEEAAGLTTIQVAYFSFIDQQVYPADSYKSTSEVLLRNIMKADDSPFEAIALPWKFNFLGGNVEEVFVSPNGGIHQSPVQPCPPLNYFATNLCNFDNAYFNLIAGYVTDLDPSKSENSSFISSAIHDDYLQVTYRNISYYNSSIANSFRIRLFDDSHIEIMYDHIVKSSEKPVPKYWASGLRASTSIDMATQVYFSPTQISLAQSQWRTLVPAVYPNQSDVISGNKFSICPVSRAWCMRPSIISASQVSEGKAIVVLSSLLQSCFSSVSYGILVSSANSRNDTPVPCHADQLMTTLECNLTSVLKNIHAGELNIIPAWRKNFTEIFTALPVDSLSLTLTSSNTTSNNSCSNNLGSTACGVESCSVCSRNYTCFDAPCAENTTQPLEVLSTPTNVLFDRPTCANESCVISSEDNYYLDYSSPQLCCLQSQMDCSGKCNGPAVVAHDKDSARYCCSGPVDCTGECGGSAQKDRCGTCGGTDTTGLGCFNQTSEIVFSTGYDDNSMRVLYDVSSNTSMNLIRTMQVNVSNLSQFSIKIQFLNDQSNPPGDAPQLTLPIGWFAIDHNSSMEFSFKASIEELYSGNTVNWATKLIKAQFYRNILPDTVYENEMKVFISSQKCSTITSRDMCMRLPACIFCENAPYMRILSDNSTAGGDSASTQTNSDYISPKTGTSLRRLYIQLVPEEITFHKLDYSLGVCGDGWTNSDCAVIAPYDFVNSADGTVKITSPRTLTLVVIVLVTLVFNLLL